MKVRRFSASDFELVGQNPMGQLPPRSELIRLEPRGEGTAFRESLSSYFLRLADRHHVSPHDLARHMVLPRLTEARKSSVERVDYLWRLSLFNGVGQVPEEWSRELERLTGRAGLVNLTLLPYKDVLPAKNLLSETKRWCPLCLHEAQQADEEYGQLLWEINVVKACPVHGVRLVGSCGCESSASLFRLNAKHHPGICKHCGVSLGQDNSSVLVAPTGEEMEKARLVAEFLGIFIDGRNVAASSRVDLPWFLRRAADCFSEGKPAWFAKMLGVGKNTLHGWIHGEHWPTFPQLVNLAWVCGCSISEVLTNTAELPECGVLRNTRSVGEDRPRRRKSRRVDRTAVERVLWEIARREPPCSVAQAATEIGVSDKYLFVNLPELTSGMTARYMAKKREEHERRFALKCQLYRQSAEKLLAQGLLPTRRLVEDDLVGVETVFSRGDRAACVRICREVVQAATSSEPAAA